MASEEVSELADDAERRLRGECCGNCVHFAAVGECWEFVGTGLGSPPPAAYPEEWCADWSQDPIHDERRGQQKRDLLQRMRDAAQG